MKQYRVTIVTFDGEGEDLKAQALYEQTIPILNVRAVIEAVNAEQKSIVTVVRKRKPRSDRGKKHSKTLEV